MTEIREPSGGKGAAAVKARGLQERGRGLQSNVTVRKKACVVPATGGCHAAEYQVRAAARHNACRVIHAYRKKATEGRKEAAGRGEKMSRQRPHKPTHPKSRHVQPPPVAQNGRLAMNHAQTNKTKTVTYHVHPPPREVLSLSLSTTT